MPSTISLSAEEHKALLDLYRHGPGLDVSHRAHILLLLHRGFTWAAIAEALARSEAGRG